MSEEEENKIYERIENAEETIKSIFNDTVHIETKTVKVGGTSSNVYVPKKYGGHPITILIWDIPDENVSYEEEDS